MRRIFFAAAAAVALTPSAAFAGPYTDELTKCLIRSASADDNRTVVQWTFAAISAHPDVKAMTNVKPDQLNELNRSTAKILDRLVLQDCRKEAVMAFKLEGAASATQTSFGTLGEAAFTNLLSDPGTRSVLTGLSTYMDEAKWEALVEDADAGYNPPTGK